MRTALFIGVAAASVAVAPAASAQQLPTAQPQVACEGCTHEPHPHWSGFEIALHGGGGGFFDTSSTAFTTQPHAQDHQFWPGGAAQGEAGWRFGRYVSLTGHFTYQNNQARDLPLGTTGGWSDAFAVGVNIRAYIGGILHVPIIDPWVAVGFDPWASVHVTHNTSIGDMHSRVTAVAVPMSIGIDFNILRHVALGVMAQVSPWVPWQSCSDSPAAAETCANSNLAMNWYGFVGGTVRFTIAR
jgi:hypothetical protein